MGQSISKKLVPRLNTALKSYEKAVARDALDDVARRRSQAAPGGYSDPNATIVGFQRDKGPDLKKEVEQEEFLKKNQGGGPQEMPEDLIKFLNDAGPLEKRVDKSLTSPKVYDSLSEEEEDGRRQKEAEPKIRTRRKMPLAEGLRDGPDGPDATQGAMGVERTTNFSTAQSEEDVAELKLTDRELAELLRKFGAIEGTSSSTADEPSRAAVASANADAEAYVRRHFPPDRPGMTDNRRSSHVSLLSSAFTYTGMPVLMKDVDSDYVGTWRGRVADLERMKLRVVTEAEATLVFESNACADEARKSDPTQDVVETVELVSREAEAAGAPLTSVVTPPEALQDQPVKKEVPGSRKGRIGSSGATSAAFLEEELRLLNKEDGEKGQAPQQ